MIFIIIVIKVLDSSVRVTGLPRINYTSSVHRTVILGPDTYVRFNCLVWASDSLEVFRDRDGGTSISIAQCMDA